MPLPTPELQAKWRRYFADNLNGTEREVEAATKAAMAAFVRGETDDRIRAAGLAAVTRLRGKTRPSSANPPITPGVPPSQAIPHLDPEEWHGPSQSQTPHHPSRTTGAAGSDPGPGHGARRDHHPSQPTRVNPTQVDHAASTNIRGAARAVQQRTVGRQQAQTEILSFRVERHDARGNRLDPVPVELRGSSIMGSISGQVSEGDEVEVSGAWRKGTLHADLIVNISTGAHISGLSSAKRRKRMLLTLTVIAIVFVLMAIAFFAFSSYQMRKFDEDSTRKQKDAHRAYCESLQKNGMRLDAECREILGVG